MTVPWTAIEVDPDRVTADLARWFPGTTTWLGEFTGSWWALIRDRAGHRQLVEAATPAALVHRLDRLDVRRATPPAAPAGGPVSGPRYSRARLAPVPDVAADATTPDLPRIAPATVPPARTPQHRAPRRGWLRTALGGLVAS